jgi:hypothetical protein
MLARRPWYEALHLPGSGQVRHARDLLLSRPFLDRIPDQSLIASDVGAGTYHVRATRDASGRYALVYIPATRLPQFGAADRTPAAVELDLTHLSGQQLAAWWYDPRTGVAQAIGVMPKQARASFSPPAGGPDWVLVLDDASCAFPAPGAHSHARPAPGAIGD